MAETGATLQNTNNELVKCIEELRERRSEADRMIMKEEEEKARVVHELQILTERLKRLDEGVSLLGIIADMPISCECALICPRVIPHAS